MAQDMSQEELHMYQQLYELMGAKVKLTCDRTVYQGIIGSIIPALRMVSLRRTTMINGEYIGNTRFRFREITSLIVVESSEVVNRYPKNDYLMDILKNKVGRKFDLIDVLYDGQLSEVSEDEKSVDEEQIEQEFTLDVPPHLKDKLPIDSTIVDCLDISFTMAVQDIFEESVIGVSFDGAQVSRFNELTSMCISTKSHVYLFDLEMLKNEAFDYGLRDILEAPTIKKVIHDCRFASDCLVHKYSTQLTNVFDTQVADYVISMQCYSDKLAFKYVSSLDCCLRNHLQVPSEYLHKRVKGLSDAEKNACLTKQPISNELRYDLIKNALYLILLHETLGKKLLDPLHKTVKAYLGVLSSATEEEINTLKGEISPPDSIPPSILMYGIQTARFLKCNNKSSVSFECKFMNPKTEQIVEPEKILNSEKVDMLKKCVNSKSEVNEDNCTLQLKSKYEKDNLNNTSAESISSSEIIHSIIVNPSFRHLDEVYHKLVNNLNLCSQYSESVIHVKPSSDYISKFTLRKSLVNHAAPNINTSNELNTHQDTGITLEDSCSSTNVPEQISTDSSDFWSQVCTSSSSLNEKYKNIKFVPAGML